MKNRKSKKGRYQKKGKGKTKSLPPGKSYYMRRGGRKL